MNLPLAMSQSPLVYVLSPALLRTSIIIGPRREKKILDHCKRVHLASRAIWETGAR